jgi:DNA repair protein RadC
MNNKQTHAVNDFAMPPVVRIQLVREDVQRYQVSGFVDAYNVASQFLENEDRENLIAILLDTSGHVNGVFTISIGDSNQAVANPREIFKAAILTNACSIILAHNHPSGKIDPSDADIEMTKRVIAAGKILNIEVLDHVIVGHKRRYSMRENNIVNFN